jgi:hypothetical protein
MALTAFSRPAPQAGQSTDHPRRPRTRSPQPDKNRKPDHRIAEERVRRLKRPDELTEKLETDHAEQLGGLYLRPVSSGRPALSPHRIRFAA